MTCGAVMLAQTCSCRGAGSDDLIPVLVAAAILVGYPFAGKWLRMLKGRACKMNVKNMAIIGAVVVAAAAIVVLKHGKKAEPAGAGSAAVGAVAPVKDAQPQGKALPRLVDLGAGKCIPCKMMKPILDDLKTTCAETFKTEFIDVWENADAGKQYGINMIPTQIFFGADGKELFRHEGFFSKEDILGKWKEFGVGSGKAE